MSDQPNSHSTYAEAAAVEDERLDERLRAIRRGEDQGEIAVREAADERIEAMEAHLARLRELRDAHLNPKGE